MAPWKPWKPWKPWTLQFFGINVPDVPLFRTEPTFKSPGTLETLETLETLLNRFAQARQQDADILV